jgi:hypothetical protein
VDVTDFGSLHEQFPYYFARKIATLRFWLKNIQNETLKRKMTLKKGGCAIPNTDRSVGMANAFSVSLGYTH